MQQLHETWQALAQAAQKELNEGEEETVLMPFPSRFPSVHLSVFPFSRFEEDAPDAWALRQLELGLHRRRGGEVGKRCPGLDFGDDLRLRLRWDKGWTLILE